MPTILAHLHDLHDAERAKTAELRAAVGHAHGDAYVSLLLAMNRQIGRLEMLEKVIALHDACASLERSRDDAA